MAVTVGALLIIVVLQAAVIFVLLMRKNRIARTEQALRMSVDQFRNMVDRAPVMLWAARPDTTLNYLNQTCVEFTGLPLEALLDNGWLTVIHPDDLEECVNTYTPAIEAREPLSFEYRIRRADGCYRWILDRGTPNYNADGTFVGYVGCSVDITERKTGEEVIHESRAALAGNHREIRQLAGRLLTAHEDERRRLARELHDDLTQQLARLAIDAGQMELAPRAPAELRTLREDLVRLSEDVHAMSYRLHPSVLDDLGLVEAVKAECDRVARLSSLQINLDVSGVPAALPGDAPLCMFRIAQEALSNALRHAHASIVTVHLASEGEVLKLTISDNGDGFDPWGPRNHVSLGLASMRERVRLIHGELDIESSCGVGTTVTAWAPLTRETS